MFHLLSESRNKVTANQVWYILNIKVHQSHVSVSNVSRSVGVTVEKTKRVCAITQVWTTTFWRGQIACYFSRALFGHAKIWSYADVKIVQGGAVGSCKVCANPIILKVNQIGANEGRPYASCSEGNHDPFLWLDEVEGISPATSTPTALRREIPCTLTTEVLIFYYHIIYLVHSLSVAERVQLIVLKWVVVSAVYARSKLSLRPQETVFFSHFETLWKNMLSSVSGPFFWGLQVKLTWTPWVRLL